MQHVVRDLVAAQRLERAGTDVQRDQRGAYTARGQRRHQRRIEMQARSRRRYRTGLAREDTLVALAVGGRRCAADVGRQRHAAEAVEELERRRGQRHAPQLALAREHLQRAAGGSDGQPGADRLVRRELHQRLVTCQGALQQDLHPPARGLGTEQPCGDDARVVEHQQVAGPQALGQIAQGAVSNRTAGAIEQQQATGRAGGGGCWAINSAGRS